MFDWLRRFFRGKADVLSNAEEKDVAVSLKEIDEGKAKRFTSADALIADLKKGQRNRTIVEKNQERQKATMGYGLKPRNFKSRPHHEVKTWDLQAKPNDTYMPCDKGKNADCGHCDVGALWSKVKECPYKKAT